MVGNKTPRALSTTICIIGRCNAGKSSLINAVAEQDVAIVSPTAGTTTDVVAKSYELLPLGPVIFYDTAGLDDEGDLGQRRMKTTRKALYRSDIALIVISESITPTDKRIINEVKTLDIPFLVVFNKNDVYKPNYEDIKYCLSKGIKYISVSATNSYNIQELKKMIIDIAPEDIKEDISLVKDLIKQNDVVILVTPIDLSAPKGRLILPQVQTLREVLDANATGIVVKESELENTLSQLKNKPNLLITDSQVVREVIQVAPKDMNITTFSILFARNKGDLDLMVKGVQTLDKLKYGDKVLIAEACSHHAQPDDIGKVKIPNLVSKYTGKKIIFDFYNGNDFPDNLEDYSLVIHCGGCMINRKEMNHRLKECAHRNIPVTNYGVVISKTQNVLERVTQILL